MVQKQTMNNIIMPDYDFIGWLFFNSYLKRDKNMSSSSIPASDESQVDQTSPTDYEYHVVATVARISLRGPSA